MTVIAMTQELGSLAKDVEYKLAETLNLQQMTNEVVEHVSGKMHVPRSLVNRMREGKAGLVERFSTDTQRLGRLAWLGLELFAAPGTARGMRTDRAFF